MKLSEYAFSLAIELTFKTSLPQSYMKMTINIFYQTQRIAADFSEMAFRCGRGCNRRRS